jgi:hypothetical protein
MLAGKPVKMLRRKIVRNERCKTLSSRHASGSE